MSRIHYITYQNFPAETGNSLQSISNIIEMVRMGNDVTLTFPNRAKDSTKEISVLQEYYDFSENFKVNRVSHPLPFGKFNFLLKFSFHVSHFLWSLGVIVLGTNWKNADYFITRSDWIFYFLSKRKQTVIFECHGESKLRQLLLKKSLKNPSSKVVFLTKSLQNFYEVDGNNEKQSLVLGSGYREDLFNKNVKKIKNQVVFVGNLLRFGTSRDIEFIIETFADERLKNYNLKIVGGPSKYVSTLKSKVAELGSKNIEFTGRLNQNKTAEMLLSSEIGILTNSSDNINSTKHTSPLKYFEYLASGLKIVAVNFESHKLLPFGENIVFFESLNKESFIFSILSTKERSVPPPSNCRIYSYRNRVEKILNLARLEGLEPPTL